MSVAGRSIGFDQLCAQLEGSLAVAFYGHNHAWMEEEAAALIAAVKRQHPSLSVSRFDADVLLKEPYRLQDALTSPGLFSQGRQLAVIDGVDERSGALVAAFLANPCYTPADGLIVLLAPGQHGSARWLQPLKTQAGVWLRDCYDETPAVRTAFVKRYLQGHEMCRNLSTPIWMADCPGWRVMQPWWTNPPCPPWSCCVACNNI